MDVEIPSSAEVVIIGGGIIGCSTAYHLARDHGADVVLLEQGELTNGSTFHAAGLVGQLRSSASITKLLKYSVELYQSLEQETGLATGWKQNGGLRLANNKERWTEIKRQATTARSFGLEMHLLTPKEAGDIWPLMETNDLLGAALLPTDGQANPSDITRSLAKGARMHGARIIEGVQVTQVLTHNAAVIGLSTSHGEIRCEKLVNCTGQWSRGLGKEHGVCIPLQSMQHQYMVTETIEGVSADLPTLRDPDRLIYFKEEVGGLVMGGYEPNPKPWDVAEIPENFSYSLLDEDWDHFEQLMQQAMIRVPVLKSAGVKSLINGPESFTVDGNFILGETAEISNYFVGAGFNAFGIASAGGAGQALAAWVVQGEQPMDLWAVDVRRFSGLHQDQSWVKTRTIEACARHYAMAWPNEEYQSARPVYTSPLYRRLKQQRACFGSKLGWERPNWFAPPGVEPLDSFSFERANWFEYVGEEHKACRERVALFDQSSFAKFELCGRDAVQGLDWLCANNINKPVGRITYTQMLNSRGGIECDLTISRISDELWYIVTGTGFRTHDFAWVKHNLPKNSDIEFCDVTEQWATLSLMGPRARDVLAAVTDSDISPEAFQFAAVQEIKISGCPVRALRITYMGELGWEIHVPIGSSGLVYDALMKSGRHHGIANAGYRAIESLRLEKGYRAWSTDITPNDSPLEAGLAWAVKLNTGIPFLGREATETIASLPFNKQLCCFTLDNAEIVLHGRETILRNGEPVGYVTSAGWGYTIGANIAYGYVKNSNGCTTEYLQSGQYELEVACERVPCKLRTRPLIESVTH
ncbi:MAG: GcvT family protein [bacterium]